MDACSLGPPPHYCEHSSEITSNQYYRLTVRYPVVLSDKTDITNETQPQLSLESTFFNLTCYIFRIFHKNIISLKDRKCKEGKAFAHGNTAS